MRRAFYLCANLFAAAVLILIALDPTRHLAPVLILLALAVGCSLAPRFLRR